MRIRIFISTIVLFHSILLGRSFGQSPINSEEQLLTAVISLNSNETDRGIELIKAHASLISKEFCVRLIAFADKSSDQSKQLSTYKLANESAALLQDTTLQALTFYKLGFQSFLMDDISSAERDLLESARLFETLHNSASLVNVLAELGNVYIYEDNYKAAKECSLESVAIAQREKDATDSITGSISYGYAVSLLNLGDVSKSDGDYKEALNYFEQAQAIFQTLSNLDPKFEADLADAYGEIGRLYRVIGDNRQALLNLNRAVDICRKLPSRDKLAGVLNSIGVLYSEQNDYDKASEYYDESLAIRQSYRESLEIARVLINKGVVAQRSHRYEEAIKDFQDAISRTDSVSVPDLRIAALEGVGAVYEEQGNAVQSIEWLEKALGLAKSTGNKTRIAEIEWRLGESYYLKNELELAISFTQNAIDISTELNLPVISFLALTAQGRYYLQINKIELASVALSKAIQNVEMMRIAASGAERERQIILENRISPFDLMVELLLKQGDSMGALRYAEMSKARVLDEVLSNGKVDLTKAMSESEKQIENGLNRELNDINRKLRNENLKRNPDKATLNQLTMQAASTRVQYESFLDTLYASHPELRIERGQPEAVTLNVLSDSVPDDVTILEYVVTDNQLILFAVSKTKPSGTVAVDVIPITISRQDLNSKIDHLRAAISERRPNYASVAREVYDLLIAPVANQIAPTKTICIIPDSNLWDVPFQALRNNSGRFLLEDHVVYYAPSIVALNTLSKMKLGRNSGLRLLAIGNPDDGFADATASSQEQSKIPSEMLRDTEVEVRDVEKALGAQQNKLLVGAEASETHFKDLSSSYNIIHIATHGVIDSDHPLYSYLLLSRDDKQNDGYLEAREIINMDLRADLVVLSACETARGKVGAGEGVIGLSWAFFIAGSRTTVVSGWKVSSASTSILMRKFYEHLNDERSSGSLKKAEALRAAELEIMKDPRYSHPFYWAAFVAVGSNQ